MGTAYGVRLVSDATLRALNYAPELDRLRAAPTSLRKGWSQSPLGSLVAEMGRTYAKVLQRVDCDPAVGEELLSQVDIFATEPSGRHIRGDRIPFVEQLRIQRGDILLAGAGQMGESTLFGRAFMADARLTGRLAAADIMMLRFAEPDADTSLYVYAFLLTAAGLRGIRAAAYGTSIPRMRPDLLAALPVPLPDLEIRQRVAALVRACMHERELYQREMLAARMLVEERPEVRDATALCAERRRRAVSWGGDLLTLMGWTYASHGGALGHLQQKWRSTLGDALTEDGAFYGLLRQRTPAAPGFGVPLITQRDALAMRPLPTWIARPSVPERALFSPPNSIVMAGRGTLGEGELFARPAFITPGLARFALTQDLLRLVPRPGSAALVDVFLSTLLGRRLLRACAAGTKICQLRLDLLRRIPLPELPRAVGEALQSHHVKAVGAFDRAAEAELRAVRLVEKEVLPTWLG